jgi:hypothetical protein
MAESRRHAFAYKFESGIVTVVDRVTTKEVVRVDTRDLTGECATHVLAYGVKQILGDALPKGSPHARAVAMDSAAAELVTGTYRIGRQNLSPGFPMAVVFNAWFEIQRESGKLDESDRPDFIEQWKKETEGNRLKCARRDDVAKRVEEMTGINGNAETESLFG